MYMKGYNDNLFLPAFHLGNNNKGKYDGMWDVKELYVFPGVNNNLNGPKDEPIWSLSQLTQEGLQSIIKDYKYKHFVR